MSTIGHPIAALAITRAAGGSASARARLAIGICLAIVSVLPDVDLYLPAVGVPDSVTLGHRGITHSLLAVAVAALVSLIPAVALHLPRVRTALVVGATMLTHSLLDTLTAGPGLRWLWPLTSHRFPVWPILPIADMSDLLSSRGLSLLVVEFVVFSPLLVYAAWPMLCRYRPRLHSKPDGARD